MTETKTETTGKSDAERRRKERLARALRENLKRRKEQARSRKPAKAPDSGRGGRP